ncbi:MAG TPA: hypothetical protein DDW52_23755, partial [Planctomycetaceae bacterium]|nr:hypothetical protein [Planctomycetaceae bacterium]
MAKRRFYADQVCARRTCMVYRESEFSAENNPEALLVKLECSDAESYDEHLEQCGLAYGAISRMLPQKTWIQPNDAIEALGADGIYLLDLIPILRSRWLVRANP